jgi:hypothetical protein
MRLRFGSAAFGATRKWRSGRTVAEPGCDARFRDVPTSIELLLGRLVNRCANGAPRCNLLGVVVSGLHRRDNGAPVVPVHNARIDLGTAVPAVQLAEALLDEEHQPPDERVAYQRHPAPDAAPLDPLWRQPAGGDKAFRYLLGCSWSHPEEVQLWRR